jgi:hypothetical protein
VKSGTLSHAVALALLGCASSAAAQTVPSGAPPTPSLARVALTLGACAGVDSNEVRRILPIELDTPLVDDATDTRALAVSVRCEGDRAVVHVEARERPFDQRLDLTTIPAVARARFLALAIAELVSVATTETPPPLARTEPAPAPTPASAPPPLPHSDAPSASRSSWALEALIHERSSLAAGLVAWGGGARAVHATPSGVEWAVDARGERGAVSVSLGSVAVTTGSLGASLGLRRTAGPLSFRGAAGARAGLSRLDGEPSNGYLTRSASFLAAWGGPFVDAGVDAALADHFVVGLAGELGADVLPAHGLVNGAREIDVGGAWLGARLSLGVLF